jgi:hypothetical protein
MSLLKRVVHPFILFLLLFPCVVFCQTPQAVRVRGFYASDSLRAKAYQAPVPLSPSRISLPGLVPDRTADVGTPVQPSNDPKCQWIRFHFSGTSWNWFVRKPGTYGGQVLVGSIQSNGKVLMEFERFNKLLCTDGSCEQVETFYAVSPPNSNISDLNWMDPDQLNAYCMHFTRPPLVPVPWALWQKVVVENCTRAAEFKDDGTICIQLLNNHTWIDGVSINQYPFDQ